MKMMKLSEKYGCAIVFGMAEKIGKRVFNTAVIVENGSYVGKYQKIHLSDFEKRFFERGTENTVFEVRGVKIGVEICFDLWFPEISREQIRNGADILFVLANFGGETTCGIAKTRAIENLTPLVICNRVGSEKLPNMDADFLGRSVILSSSGELLSVEKSHCEVFDSVNIEVGKRRANVICGDFKSEINFHYKN